jgi:hypothetical protein
VAKCARQDVQHESRLGVVGIAIVLGIAVSAMHKTKKRRTERLYATISLAT